MTTRGHLSLNSLGEAAVSNNSCNCLGLDFYFICDSIKDKDSSILYIIAQCAMMYSMELSRAYISTAAPRLLWRSKEASNSSQVYCLLHSINLGLPLITTATHTYPPWVILIQSKRLQHMSVSEISLHFCKEGLSGDNIFDKVGYKAVEEVPSYLPGWSNGMTKIPLPLPSEILHMEVDSESGNFQHRNVYRSGRTLHGLKTLCSDSSILERWWWILSLILLPQKSHACPCKFIDGLSSVVDTLKA